MFSSARLTIAEAFRLLEARLLPGRLTAAEAAVILGFESHEMPILVARGLIKPLGKPAPNSTKYFAAEKVSNLRRDEAWLDRATIAVAKHWRSKNERKTHSNLPLT